MSKNDNEGISPTGCLLILCIGIIAFPGIVMCMALNYIMPLGQFFALWLALTLSIMFYIAAKNALIRIDGGYVEGLISIICIHGIIALIDIILENSQPGLFSEFLQATKEERTSTFTTSSLFVVLYAVFYIWVIYYGFANQSKNTQNNYDSDDDIDGDLNI